jgi:hypothetical protein
VLERVGQALLNDAEGRRVEARGDLGRRALDAQRDRQPRVPGLRDESIELSQCRPRPAITWLLVDAKCAEQAGELIERLSAHLENRLQSWATVAAPRSQQLLAGPRLKDDHADAASDGVVQIASHARAFLHHGEPCPRVALAPQPPGEHLQALGLHPVRADGKA